MDRFSRQVESLNKAVLGLPMRVSIIIPVFNAERYLERCIESFQHQDLPAEEFEVLFVDNNSQDRSTEMILDSGPNMRLLRERKQGAYAARNCGLKVTRGEFIAFTDPDCVPRSDWLSQICQLLSDEKTQVVIGRVDCPSGSSGMSLLALYEHHKNRYILSGDDPLSYCAHTNNMAVRLKTLDRFGPFVDHPRGADTVFVRKVVDALGPGVVRYAEGMRVEHRELRSPRLYFKKMFIYGGSFQSYSRVVAARSIGTRERVTIWWRTCREEGLAVGAAAHLLAVLILGAPFWYAGRLAGAGRSRRRGRSHG